MLTLRQKEVLEFIVEYSSDNGYPPSRLDIACNFLFGPNAAQCHLKAIEKKGYITLTKGINRGIKIVKKPIR